VRLYFILEDISVKGGYECTQGGGGGSCVLYQI